MWGGDETEEGAKVIDTRCLEGAAEEWARMKDSGSPVLTGAVYTTTVKDDAGMKREYVVERVILDDEIEYIAYLKHPPWKRRTEL